MIRTTNLVRCPSCGSRRIKSLSLGNKAEMLCYCRSEGVVMETVDARLDTLVDPDEDRYSFDSDLDKTKKDSAR